MKKKRDNKLSEQLLQSFNKQSKLQRLLETDPLISATNPYYNCNYSNEDYIINFFCVYKLGFGKQCPNDKKCIEHWNSEWEGELLKDVKVD